MTGYLPKAALPTGATVAFVVTVAAIVWSAGSTLGYDFHAYAGAARRLIEGARLYDPAVDVAGGFAIYLYPPPFAIAIVPFALLGGAASVWLWTLLLVAAFALGVALLPVKTTVRWAIVLLAALDWPFLYSVKLGQVGPILFLLFAVGWRSIVVPERSARLGLSIGLGTLVKVQPGLLLVWAALTGRARTVVVGAVVVAVASLASVIVSGLQPWLDYPALLGRVASPLTTPHNFTPGAVAFQAGASTDVAGAIQVISTAAALVALVIAARVARPDASYLVAVVASQLISPLLWDHYAMLLLLPVAWLLERRQWWAVLVPASTSILVIGLLPAAVYPLAFATCLLAPIVAGRRPAPEGGPA